MTQDLSKLDPKLKEAYDRVMGTSITPPQPAKPNVQESHSVPPSAPHPTMTTVNPPPHQDETSVVHKASGAKKKGGISPLVLALAGLIFFIAYGVIWVKIFNLSVPFLNP